MSNFINYMIAIVIALFMTLGTAMFFTSTIEEEYDSRLTLNAVSNYIDTFRDSGRLTAEDYSDFLKNLHSTGREYDILIQREKRVVYNANGDIHSKWFPAELFDNSSPITKTVEMNRGDRVSVTVKIVSDTTASRIVRNIFNVRVGRNTTTLSGVVRNG